MNLLTAVAAATFLTLAGCTYEYDCSHTDETRSVEGEIVLTESKESREERLAYNRDLDSREHRGGETWPQVGTRITWRIAGAGSAMVLDDACPSAAWGCVSLGRSSAEGLTFRRPADAGTFTLRELGAKACELVVEYRLPTAPPAGTLRCSDVDGRLIVRAVVAPCPSPDDPEGGKCGRLDADLTIEARADDAPGPLVSGTARLDIRDERVNSECTGGGVGFGLRGVGL